MPGRTSSVRMLPILFCLLAFFIAACGGSDSNTPATSGTPAPGKPAAAAADKQVFRYPIGPSDFGSLDPALIGQSIDTNAAEMIFTGMVQLDGDGNVMDQQAASHNISSDGLTYTFTLKPNLQFSDGTPLTANDIAYTINRVLQPETKSPLVSFLEPIKDYDKITAGKIKTVIGDSIVVKDDQTIVITLGHPAAYFLQALAGSECLTVNKKLIEKYGNGWTDHLSEGAGSGPFIVQSYIHNKGLVLTPNPKYYGAKPQLQRVEFLRSGDTSATYKAYQVGQYDFATVPRSSIAQVKDRKDFRNVPSLAVYYLTMNYLARPFDNIKIRQAFALAVNKDILMQTVMHGAVIPTNHYIPEGMPGYYKDLTGPAGVTGTKGDTNKAKQLLAEGLQEAGYGSVSKLPPISLTYYTGDPDQANLMAALAQEWQTTLGISVQLTGIDIDTLVQKSLASAGNSGPLQLWFVGFGNYPDPQGWISFYFEKGASFNTLNYGQNNSTTAASQQAVQADLAKADVNQDPKQRLQQYNAAEQKLVDDVAWIPLYQDETQVLVNPKLQNYPLHALGIVEPDAWGNIYMAQ